MSRYDYDSDSSVEPIRPKKTKRFALPASFTAKQSFEQSPDVQRWLVEQAKLHKNAESEKPPFDPPFLSAHHERVWLLSSLEQFYQRDLITDVVSVAKSGKEATVYCCTADPATGLSLLAAKTYRPRMFRSLKNDAIYRQSRASLDERGRFSRRSRMAAAGTNERARALQVSAWIAHEYQTQRRVYEAGADVPAILSQAGNAILMDYIGDADSAAPLLKHVRLEPEEAQPLFDRLIHNIELFLRHHCIHGDLSAYNILYWEGRVIVIDFAQAVDPRVNPDVYPLLQRDLERVCRYFAPYGIAADADALANAMWLRYLMGDLAI